MTWQVKQEVNFYLEEFHPPSIPSDLKQILIGVAIHFALAVLIIFGLLINWYWQGARLTSVTERHSIVEHEVTSIEKMHPPLQLRSDLVEERDNARTHLESSHRILRYLTQQDLAKSHSFTSLVTELGEQNIPGVWLTHFGLYDEGSNVSLEGFTDNPAKVSRYVSTLLSKEAYRDHAFRFVDVRKDEKSAWLRFELDTRSREEAEDIDTKKLVSKDLSRRLLEGKL